MNVPPCDCRTLPHVARSEVLQSCWGANTVGARRTFSVSFSSAGTRSLAKKSMIGSIQHGSIAVTSETPIPALILGSATNSTLINRGILMQRRRVEAESVTHNYYNSSTILKFYKNTRLIGKIIEKTSLANFYSKTHITTIIINPFIKSIYNNRISPTSFMKRNNKLTSTNNNRISPTSFRKRNNKLTST